MEVFEVGYKNQQSLELVGLKVKLLHGLTERPQCRSNGAGKGSEPLTLLDDERGQAL